MSPESLVAVAEAYPREVVLLVGAEVLTVIMPGKRLPGDRRTAGLSVRALRCGIVAAVEV